MRGLQALATKISYYYAGWMEKVDAQPALVPARITSRDCHTQFFAVAVPRLLASEECGIILLRLALKNSVEVFSVSTVAKLQRHDAGRARIAAIAS